MGTPLLYLCWSADSTDSPILCQSKPVVPQVSVCFFRQTLFEWQRVEEMPHIPDTSN